MRGKISLLMANYNKAAYIKEALNSVIGQTFVDWELIIVDDASTDDSLHIINTNIIDDRIKLIKNKINLGYTKNLITMINAASAEIVGILDSDDALAPTALEEVFSVYRNHPEVGLVYSQCQYCDSDLKPVHPGYSKSIPANSSNLHLNAIHAFRTFSKEAYFKTPGYDESIIFAEDIDLTLKLEEVTKICFIDSPLYYYRILPKSQTHSFRNETINRSSTALAKLNAYKRRIGKSITNLDKQEIAEVLFFGIFTSLLARRFNLVISFIRHLVIISPLFFVRLRFYLLAMKKIRKFADLKFQAYGPNNK